MGRHVVARPLAKNNLSLEKSEILLVKLSLLQKILGQNAEQSLNARSGSQSRSIAGAQVEDHAVQEFQSQQKKFYMISE